MLALGIGLVVESVAEKLDRRRFRRGGILIDGLWVKTAGEGPDVVLFEAGLAATSLTWTPVERLLSSDTRVVTYDRGGLGWSSAKVEPSLSALVSRLVSLIEVVSPSRPVILGAHSFGAIIVRTLAAQRPDLVRGLLLVDPVSISQWSKCNTIERRRLQVGARLSRRGAWLAQLGIVRLLLWLLTRGASPGALGIIRLLASVAAGRGSDVAIRLTREMSRLPRYLWPVLRAHWSRPASFRALAEYLDALTDCVMSAEAYVVPADIAVLILSASSATSSELAERGRWAEVSNCGTHEVIPGTNHWIQLTAPERVAEAALRMLAQSDLQKLR